MEKSGEVDAELLDRAIRTWGPEAQQEMIIEECLELALALQKMKRLSGDHQEKYNQIIDEIADVKIMIAQAQRLYHQEAIDKRVDYKMNRLKERLDKSDKEKQELASKLAETINQ